MTPTTDAFSEDSLSELGSDRFLAFSLGDDEYGVPLLKVKEVIAMPEVTPVPYTQPHMKGVMNLRGQVISILDLRLKFRMQPGERSAETAVIILDLSPFSFGIIVDSVNSVFSVEESKMSAPPDTDGHSKTDYLLAIARRDNGQLTLILDIEKSLDVNDLNDIKRAAA